MAGLINAAKLTARQLSDCKVVVVGAGAAGTAIIKLLHDYAQPEILALDSRGIISSQRDDINDEKRALLKYTNPHQKSGNLEQAIVGADIFIGVSKGGLLDGDLVQTMAADSIIFAMANPTPEIMPDVARAAGAAVVATGRSDLANQVNNALAFPGIFRGALDHKVGQITSTHKIAAAEAIAGLVKKPTAERIIPTVFEPRLVTTVAKTIT